LTDDFPGFPSHLQAIVGIKDRNAPSPKYHGFEYKEGSVFTLYVWNMALSATAWTAGIVYRYIDKAYQRLFSGLAAIHDTCHSSSVTSET
jgi:hypothetical protein